MVAHTINLISLNLSDSPYALHVHEVEALILYATSILSILTLSDIICLSFLFITFQYILLHAYIFYCFSIRDI